MKFVSLRLCAIVDRDIALVAVTRPEAALVVAATLLQEVGVSSLQSAAGDGLLAPSIREVAHLAEIKAKWILPG